jgi:hypothetical protein
MKPWQPLQICLSNLSACFECSLYKPQLRRRPASPSRGARCGGQKKDRCGCARRAETFSALSFKPNSSPVYANETAWYMEGLVSSLSGYLQLFTISKNNEPALRKEAAEARWM